MTRQMELVDSLMAGGHEEFTFEQARQTLGSSPTATAGTLRGLRKQGLIDRVARGHYAIRPLGSLGTRTSADDLGLAVGAAFEGWEHRIAYRTALAELNLLSHPVRTLFVACTQQVRITAVSGLPLQVVIESPETIHMDADVTGRSWRSTLDRALFESALRVDLTGGVERLTEALANSAREADAARIGNLAGAFGPRGAAASRRIASLAKALELPMDLEPEVGHRQPLIRLDPRDERVEWVDGEFRVTWNRTVDELRAVLGY